MTTTIGKVFLEVERSQLDSLQSSIRSAQAAVKTAWTPDYEHIVSDLDVLLKEVERMQSMWANNVNHKVVNSEGTSFDCLCSINKDHFYSFMDQAELFLISLPKEETSEPEVIDLIDTSSVPVINPIPHLVFHEDRPRVGFTCTCPKENDHIFSIMTEVEVSHHVNIDAITRGEYDTERR